MKALATLASTLALVLITLALAGCAVYQEAFRAAHTPEAQMDWQRSQLELSLSRLRHLPHR